VRVFDAGSFETPSDIDAASNRAQRMGDYRKLEVWMLGSELSDRIALVVEGLPARIRAGKGDQIMRAADSIHENIAEGCGLNSDRQLAKHLRISLGSANEVEDELATLNRRGYLKEKDKDLIPATRRLCAKIAKFIQRLEPADPPHGRRGRR
jgi:four helix bundle protein